MIDLRGNPGGPLASALDLAALFLPRGRMGASYTYPPVTSDDALSAPSRASGHSTIVTRLVLIMYPSLS